MFVTWMVTICFTRLRIAIENSHIITPVRSDRGRIFIRGDAFSCTLALHPQLFSLSD